MPSALKVPREKGLDHTFDLLTEGYMYIPNRCHRFQSTIFETHFLGLKVICMSGEEAARIFYDSEKFHRHGAIPKRIRESIFGEKGVQTLDGAEHDHRKEMFMSLMTRDQLTVLTALTKNEWQKAAGSWNKRKNIILFEEVQKIMLRVACRWAGVPLKKKEEAKWANDFGAIIDSFGAVGPRHWRGRTARNHVENWLVGIIKAVRARKLDPAVETALYEMSWHRDLKGDLLDVKVATVELINIIRPIVAIARYITYGALALHEYPETRKKLKENNVNYSQLFVQEVRRFYPFGPFLGAKVSRDFIWEGCHFQKGGLVFLDIYGTNHDPALWQDPNEFRPERFRDWQGNPFDFIPQGGGDYMGHRCAGEWVTIEVMKESLEFLTRELEYHVPKQDLSISTVRMAAIPKSRFVISGVRRKRK